MLSVASLVDRARRAPPWAADAVLAATVLTIGVLEIVFFQAPLPPFRVAEAWSIPLFALMSLPLAIRRTNLWAAYIVIQTAAVVAGQTHLVVSFGLGYLLVANVLLYSVGEQSNVLVSVALTLGQVGYFYSLEFEARAKDRSSLLDDLLFFLPFFGFAAFAGWAQQRRRQLTTELEARRAEVQRERELLAGQAVTQERIRITKELRHLVVQGVRQMTRLATSARRDVQMNNDGAGSEIAAIEAAGRRSLVEMRRLLGVLRRVDEADEHALVAADDGAIESEVGVRREFTRLRWRVLKEALQRWPGRSLLIDAAIALVIAGLAVLEFTRADPTDPTFQGWVPPALSVIVVMAVLVRRAAPFTVLTLIASCEFVWILVTGNAPGSADRALLVAVYTVAANKDVRWAIAAIGMGLYAWSLLPVKYLCLCEIEIGALSIFAVIAGHSILVGRQINRDLAEETGLLERTRHQRIRSAVSDERTRLARELHDVVAHAVTGMVVQAGGARMVVADDPRLAEATLQEVEQMGRDALQELHGLVEVLDPVSASSRQEAHEEMPDVSAFIKRVRRAGQEVVFEEEGEPIVDEGLRISVYRIVQETLTNVRKHAAGATATVVIRYLPDAVEIQVTNGESPRAASDEGVPGAGQGLIGIRERASVFGGQVEAGATPDGGFEVSVHLPLELVSA